MTDIQRYRTNHISGDYYVDPDGELVTYADHVEAVRQAEQRGRGYGVVEGFTRGQRDALTAAVQVINDYANERLAITGHPNASEDITAALRAVAQRVAAIKGVSE